MFGAPTTLTASSALLALVVLLPLFTLVASGFGAGAEAWRLFAGNQLALYAANSLLLALGTAFFSALIGITAAWLVTMCAFPLRRFFEWALVLPLAAPAYIVAYAYADFLQHAGPVQTALRAAFDLAPRDYWFPNIRSLPGAIAVFSLVLYPYVYLLVRATLIEQSVCVLEASRSLGCRPFGTFWRVALPLARPAIVGGTALAVMEALADFGAVQHFAVPTFTTAIYQSFAVLGDRALAAQFAIALLTLVLTLLVIEHSLRGRGTTRTTTGYVRAMPRYRLSFSHGALAILACAMPLFLGALLPAGLLLQHASAFGHSLLSARYLSLIMNTVLLGLLAAGAIVITSIVLSYAQRLTPSQFVKGLVRASALGYIVPGSIIAIGTLVPLIALDRALINFSRSVFGADPGLLLSGSIIALVYAYLVRFLMVGLRPIEASLARVTPAMEQAARTLGAGETGALLRVHLPLMRAGVLTSGLIVFVETVKELPATLILRPFNFDTLAIQAYRLASDERLAEASSAALAILAVGLVSVFLLTRTISTARISDRLQGSR